MIMISQSMSLPQELRIIIREYVGKHPLALIFDEASLLKQEIINELALHFKLFYRAQLKAYLLELTPGWTIYRPFQQILAMCFSKSQNAEKIKDSVYEMYDIEPELETLRPSILLKQKNKKYRYKGKFYPCIYECKMYTPSWYRLRNKSNCHGITQNGLIIYSTD